MNKQRFKNKVERFKRDHVISMKRDRVSSTNESYYKYTVTIQNKDGKILVIPQYGKDAQHVLRKIVRDRMWEKFISNWPFYRSVIITIGIINLIALFSLLFIK